MQDQDVGAGPEIDLLIDLANFGHEPHRIVTHAAIDSEGAQHGDVVVAIGEVECVSPPTEVNRHSDRDVLQVDGIDTAGRHDSFNVGQIERVVWRSKRLQR